VTAAIPEATSESAPEAQPDAAPEAVALHRHQSDLKRLRKRGYIYAELRRIPVIGRWVIISRTAEAALRFRQRSGNRRRQVFAPFCPGNEDKTPPEILAYHDPTREKTSRVDGSASFQIKFLPCRSKGRSIAKAKGIVRQDETASARMKW